MDVFKKREELLNVAGLLDYSAKERVGALHCLIDSIEITAILHFLGELHTANTVNVLTGCTNTN